VCKIDPVQTTPVIGRPLGNIRVYLLDEHQQPVPVGIPGEVFVSGTGVARGYLHNPALTAERFIPDPFSNSSGARLYRTFDLARYKPDGNIEFLGRIDHQVKIRGYRIEPGEIEAALRTHPALGDVIVTTAEDVSGEKALVAYVVSMSQPAPDVDELKRFLRERLPAYMVPSEFALLDSLPVAANGKLDLKALPSLTQIRSETRDACLAPRTSSEQMLATIWSELLHREPIGIYDNFFELGGHSILATQVVMRIRQLFEIDLPLSAIFESITLADLNLKILQHQLQQNDNGMETMLEELEHLSEEEVRALLEA
jgi:acyl carrier protein